MKEEGMRDEECGKDKGGSGKERRGLWEGGEDCGKEKEIGKKRRTLGRRRDSSVGSSFDSRHYFESL